MVLPCQDPLTKIRVDLIFSFSPYERGAIQRAGGVEIGAAQVRFASVEDLIIHKVIAGRPRDPSRTQHGPDVSTRILPNRANRHS